MHWFVDWGVVEEPGAQSALHICGNRIYFCTGAWAKCSAPPACARCAGTQEIPHLNQAPNTPLLLFSFVGNKDFSLKDKTVWILTSANVWCWERFTCTVTTSASSPRPLTRNHHLDKGLESSRSAASCSLESARIWVMPLGCDNSSLVTSLSCVQGFKAIY